MKDFLIYMIGILSGGILYALYIFFVMKTSGNEWVEYDEATREVVVKKNKR